MVAVLCTFEFDSKLPIVGMNMIVDQTYYLTKILKDTQRYTVKFRFMSVSQFICCLCRKRMLIEAEEMFCNDVLYFSNRTTINIMIFTIHLDISL